MSVDVMAEAIRQIVERLSDGILLVDRQGCCLYLNREAERILGRKASDLVAKRLRETAPEVVGRVCEDALGRVLAGEEVMLIRSFFAQDRWYEVLGRPLDSNQNFLLHFRDITERLQAEAARHHTEEQFRLLVTGVRDYAIFWLDPKGQIASWNVGAQRLYGYSADEILGKHVSILFPPEDAQRGVPTHLIEAAAKRGSLAVEGWRVRKDGSKFLVSATDSTIYNELGEPSGFAIVAHDITERRRLEEQLRDSDERHRLAVEAGDVGTWEEALGEGRLMVDRQFLVLCGLPLDRQPNFADFLSVVSPHDREYFLERRRQVLAAEDGYEFEFEYRVDGRTGTTRWVETHGRVLGSENDPKNKRRVFGVIRDMTRRHQIDEFRRLAAGVIAHDLRSPLSAIKLSSQILIEGGSLPATAARKIQAIVGKVDRMAHMVEQLLLYTQAEFGGGFPLDRARTDLEEVCRSVLSEVQAAHPNCEIHFEAEGDCCGVWDRGKLTEVACNLVENAVKYGQPGQPIHLVARDEGDQVTLQIHNLGPPIPTELLQVIFEPFRRGEKQGRSLEGSFGLGLYIAREIVVAHGGKIDVRSLEATGTTFTVKLPRGVAAHPAPAL
jgi:PAS domain S-box-containing protein